MILFLGLPPTLGMKLESVFVIWIVWVLRYLDEGRQGWDVVEGCVLPLER